MRKRFSSPAIASSEITSESAYLNRRQFMQGLGVAAAPVLAGFAAGAHAAPGSGGEALNFTAAKPGAQGFYTDEVKTPLDDVSSYCNFYEFGTDKGDPARYASEMSVDPWSIEVTGEVAKPGKLHLEI